MLCRYVVASVIDHCGSSFAVVKAWMSESLAFRHYLGLWLERESMSSYPHRLYCKELSKCLDSERRDEGRRFAIRVSCS